MSGLPRLDGTLGNGEIGVAIATFLFGIETLQTFNYYRDYPRDRLALKILVGGIWLLELAHVICSWNGLYYWTVTFYGQPQHLPVGPFSLVAGILIQEIIKFFVQSFFTYCVQVLSKRWPIPILASTLTTVRLAFNVALVAELSKNPAFTVVTVDSRWMMITITSIGPVVDIAIAASLCYFLWSTKGKTTFSGTSKMLDTLVIWTVETTALTAFSGALELIFFLARDDLTWLVFYFIQAKVLGNSMVASLNSRHQIRAGTTDGHSVHTGGFDSAAPTQHPSNTALAIHLHKMTVTSDEFGNPKAETSGVGRDRRSRDSLDLKRT
ncbi:hypothetical protein B0H12DRAFT_1323108 [Mycena haematopus]|nr:hypothetical protein B0H12DRAFT_1323108 [Mycena haematopus]